MESKWTISPLQVGHFDGAVTVHNTISRSFAFSVSDEDASWFS